MRPHDRVICLFVLFLTLLPVFSTGMSFAAWWTGLGPSLAVYEASTSTITYSICNASNGTIGHIDFQNVLNTDTAPKFGSSFAATGWYDTNTTWASLFYQVDNGSIVNSLYVCDFAAGAYHHQLSEVISDAPGAPAVNTQTGLSVMLLGQEAGYRLFFHDEDKTIQMLNYSQGLGWSYAGSVSPDPGAMGSQGLAIASSFTTLDDNVVLATSMNSTNILVSQLEPDGYWQTTTVPDQTTNPALPPLFSVAPFTLSAWNGAPGALGLAADGELYRYMFYIGEDRGVHGLMSNSSGEDLPNGPWLLLPNMTQTVWPLADQPNGDFAIASDVNTSNIRLYYTAGSAIVEAKWTNGSWSAAGPVPILNSGTGSIVTPPMGSTPSGSTYTTTSPGQTVTSAPPVSPAIYSNLSRAAYISIGIGAGLVGFLLIGFLVWVFHPVRRKREVGEPDVEGPRGPAAVSAPESDRGAGAQAANADPETTVADTTDATYAQDAENAKGGASFWRRGKKQENRRERPRSIARFKSFDLFPNVRPYSECGNLKWVETLRNLRARDNAEQPSRASVTQMELSEHPAEE